MDGYAQLKFVMMECSKTQICLTGLICTYTVALFRRNFHLKTQTACTWSAMLAFLHKIKKGYSFFQLRIHENELYCLIKAAPMSPFSRVWVQTENLTVMRVIKFWLTELIFALCKGGKRAKLTEGHCSLCCWLHHIDVIFLLLGNYWQLNVIRHENLWKLVELYNLMTVCIQCSFSVFWEWGWGPLNW